MGLRTALTRPLLAAVALAISAPIGDAAGRDRDAAPLATHAGSSLRVTVQPGETLWRIARRHGLGVDELARANGIADPTRVRAGRVLVVPQPDDVGPGDVAPDATDAAALPRAAPPPVAAPPEPLPRAPLPRTSAPAPRRPGPEIDAGDLAAWDALADYAEASLERARFDEALQAAESGLGRLAPLGNAAELRRRRARLEVVVASVHLAHARRDAAAASLKRALREQPGLQLDPDRTSPKLVDLLADVRALETPTEPADDEEAPPDPD